MRPSLLARTVLLAQRCIPGWLQRMGLEAVVKDGHLRLEEPTDLPEGTVLELVVDAEESSIRAEEAGMHVILVSHAEV